MRAILVDDEPIMRRSFMRNSAGIPELDIIGQFENASDALAFAQKNSFELAFLDVEMPRMNGVELAVELKKLRPELLIVFISAYEEYVRESNRVGGDYFIVKPYNPETIEMVAKKMQALSGSFKKNIHIQMFGRFTVLKCGMPVKLGGKPKEILALIASRCGREISNEELYSIVWEGREYDNISMKVYYNALRRLKNTLAEYEISDLLLSTQHGQMLNTKICDCDYFAWKEKNADARERFEGEFLSEYSWGEPILAGILNDY